MRVPLIAIAFSLASAPPSLGLANRVFVSQRSGNDANSCDNILTPCQTFAGAVVQLNPGGQVIVLDSGGYGPVTITQAVTIEAPAGVTAFIHPPSGDAITVAAGASDVVTLHGLVLNDGTGTGIKVNAIGTLNVESCFITGFAEAGVWMASAGQLAMKETNVKACDRGVLIDVSSGSVHASVDHCHLDENIEGFFAKTTAPGGSTTTARYSTANGNSSGWICGSAGSGKDVLDLDSCTGSENTNDGLIGNGANALSVLSYSDCIFANNGGYGVRQGNASTVETRGNNSITGNASGATTDTIISFSPL